MFSCLKQARAEGFNECPLPPCSRSVEDTGGPARESHGSLKSIEVNCQRGPQNCLLDVLEMWLQQVDPPPTWTPVIDAVEFIGKKQLGKDLRHNKFGSKHYRTMTFWQLK